MRILIDGDGCPVVNMAISIAGEYGVPCIIFCDEAHVFHREGAQVVQVSKGADSVDFALVNRLQAGDIVITQDYGLAAMCLAKKGVPINQDGMIYHEGNIEGLLSARHTAQKIRRGGGRLRGPKKRTKEQDEGFQEGLRGLLRR